MSPEVIEAVEPAALLLLTARLVLGCGRGIPSAACAGVAAVLVILERSSARWLGRQGVDASSCSSKTHICFNNRALKFACSLVFPGCIPAAYSKGINVAVKTPTLSPLK